MINPKFLANYILILALSFAFLFPNISIAADKVTDVAEAEIVAGVEELGIDDSSSRLALKYHNPSDGTFFRTFDYGDTVGGSYSQGAKYYDSDLFSEVGKESAHTKTKIFSLDRSSVKNYLGAIFFGIWSYTNTAGDGETIKQIEVPVREVVGGKMFTTEGGKKYKPRIIWKTGHIDEPLQADADGKKYKLLPCKGSHTEAVFIQYVKSAQKVLWAYFMEESSSVTAADKKLDMIGFKLFSSNDACDECYESLHKLQMECREELKDFQFISGKDASDKDRPVPFLITFEASTFYHPERTNFYGSQKANTYGSSLFFYPKVIKPLIRLSKESSTGYDCYASPSGARGEEDIEHSPELALKEFNQPTFILIRVNDGKEVKVKLK